MMRVADYVENEVLSKCQRRSAPELILALNLPRDRFT